MRTARTQADSLKEQICVVGAGNTANVNAVLMFDSSGDAWSTVASLPGQREVEIERGERGATFRTRGEAVKMFLWRRLAAILISGFDPIGSNLGRQQQIGQYMQFVQRRINTGDCASC